MTAHIKSLFIPCLLVVFLAGSQPFASFLGPINGKGIL